MLFHGERPKVLGEPASRRPIIVVHQCRAEDLARRHRNESGNSQYGHERKIEVRRRQNAEYTPYVEGGQRNSALLIFIEKQSCYQVTADRKEQRDTLLPQIQYKRVNSPVIAFQGKRVAKNDGGDCNGAPPIERR